MNACRLKATFEKKIMETTRIYPTEKLQIPAIISVLLFLFSFSLAQNRSNSISSVPDLMELKGFTQNYYYSAGHEDRALKLAKLMEDAGRFYKEELGFTPEIKMFILAPQHWKAYAAPPLHDVYGFPHNIDKVRLAVASEDNDFWRSFLKNPDQLPNEMKRRVTAAYGTAGGNYSMEPFFDLLAIHEMGHSYTSQAGLKTQRHWMEELFVNIMLHTYIAEKKKNLLPALETFPDMVVNAGSAAYRYTSLADFEKLYQTMGMGPENYGWYQSMLHSQAKNIYNAGGKSIMKKLWKALKNNQKEMTDEEFAARLLKNVHPSVANVYLKWNIPN